MSVVSAPTSRSTSPLIRGPRPNGDPVGHRKMERRKRTLARLLADWSGGLVRVDFEPRFHPEGDPQAAGHVYTAFLDTAAGEDLMILDDRRIDELRRDHELSLKIQMIHELERVGRIYLGLVQDLRAKLDADLEADQPKPR